MSSPTIRVHVIPDLSVANHQVWVQFYGLVDSPKLRAKPGQVVNHAVVLAPSEAAAAHYYPVIYWFTMMKMPPESPPNEAFPGEGLRSVNLSK